MGCVKVNVDASVFAGAEFFSIGMVLRDCEGQFLEAKTIRLPGITSVMEAETMGVSEALSWLESKDLMHAIVETDSLNTIQALKKQCINRLEVGHIVQDCRAKLHSNPGFRVSFVKKCANKVAHELARIPCMLNCFIVFTSPPPLVLEILLYDSSF